MQATIKRKLIAGMALLVVFALWTALVQLVDVQPVGQKSTDVGFATLNMWFHQLTGVHMQIYTITDWLALVPIGVCLGFATLGAVQLVGRRGLLKVDPDILLLGAYYIAVIFFYLLFEMVPVNYRPIPIDGTMEASYPSSTTLLVLSVMPALKYQVDRRANSPALRKATAIFVTAFSAFMVVARLVSGVHWATDIVGSALLASALFVLYRCAVRRQPVGEGRFRSRCRRDGPLRALRGCHRTFRQAVFEKDTALNGGYAVGCLRCGLHRN